MSSEDEDLARSLESLKTLKVETNQRNRAIALSLQETSRASVTSSVIDLDSGDDDDVRFQEISVGLCKLLKQNQAKVTLRVTNVNSSLGVGTVRRKDPVPAPPEQSAASSFFISKSSIRERADGTLETSEASVHSRLGYRRG